MSDSFVRRRLATCLGVPALLCLLAPVAQAQPDHPLPDHLTQPAVVLAPAVDSLEALVELAWRRSTQTMALLGQQQVAEAAAQQGRSWLAGAPSVVLGQRSGQRPEQRDLREQELALQLPLASHERRAAQLEAAKASQAAHQAQLTRWRLDLSHQVLERVLALRLASLKVEQAQAQRQALERLAQEVHKRVSAGDLAPLDALLIRQDTVAAEARLRQAQLDQLEAQRELQQWVGPVRLSPTLEALAVQGGARDDWPTHAPDVVDRHPRLLAAAAAAQASSAALRLQAAMGRSPWELELQHRWDQEGQVRRTATSWGLNLKIPLANEPSQRQSIAQAQSQVELAQQELRLTREQLALQWREALEGVQHAQAMQAQAQSLAEVSTERLALIRKAFELGEMSLSERLRAELMAASAAIELAEQTTRLAQARARLQHAQGMQP